MVFLLCSAIFVAVVLLIAILMKQDRRPFEQRFPPISDAEFLACCAPGTDPAIALKVRRIIADQLGIDYERIHPSMTFVEDLGAD